MSKISEYLGKNLSGEVTTEPAVRQYFSTDGSILKYTPQVVIYPRTLDDIRKTVRFAWRLAEKGYKLPIIPRGYGSSDVGAAIGTGAVMVFPAHLQKVLELDTKVKQVRVQAGMNVRALQEVLATHGLFLPIFPINMKFASVGGAIADNTSGPKGLRYGSMRQYVNKLEVVLSSGEVVQTERLSKRDLNAKKGLQTLEGEIYRELDALITENQELINSLVGRDMASNTGYRLDMVKAKDGSFDLTPLIVGSQGTLAVISQAILNLAPRPIQSALMVVALPETDDLSDVIGAILGHNPSTLDYIDGAALEWVERQTGVAPLGNLSKQKPAGVLFIEFDDGDGQKSKAAKKVMKMLDAFGATIEIAETQDDKEDIWGARYSISSIFNYHNQGIRPMQFSGATVPIEKVSIFLEKLRELIVTRKIEGYISGRVGTGELGVVALIDVGRLGDRQAAFGFMQDYCKLAVKLGGSIAGDNGDGRLRIAVAQSQYGDEMAGIYERVKEIFDPKGILNPGVIVPAGDEDLINYLNTDPAPRFLDYWPRV